MTYQTYEFTAFTEADLTSGNDTNLGCGDSFTMPGSATTCISVTDNDGSLSGDNRRNENANDKHGQNASITGEDGNELGNGGQIYAEKYWWVCDTAGNWYVMIEIEQEGSNDDYFAFYNGYGYSTPEPGTELTVYSSCNVKGNWVDYNCLDAGEKDAPNPWVLDDACVYTIQAEDFDLHGFKVVDGAQAEGGELVKISGHDGKISTEFGGETGVYNLTICAQDECDGASKLMVYVNGEFQETIRLEGQETTIGNNNHGFSAFTLNGLEIVEGDVVEIRAWRDGNEFVRIDEIKFEQVKFEECDLEGAVKLDFEGFAAGDVLGTQIDGVTISAMGGSDEAMIFDSQNPTGGDFDLETRATQQGNVLIVSEDGDSSDPDDVVGGKITFEFDNPATIFDLKFIDTEEGGTVTLTLADGSTQTFDIPELVNGGVGQLVMDVADVVRMDVQMDGSGAIDDLCYVPGEEPLGSLSGRYFCDVDRDDVDNNEPGVQGVVVYLLDAAGNRTGEQTTTDDNGDYSFGNLVAGTYGVEFVDENGVTVGKSLVAANDPDGNGDDTNDSDAIGDAQNSRIEGIVVVAGENTPDNDAGIEDLPGSLSGRYFCDDDRDGLDNDGADNGLAGVTVVLLDANGDPATDIDGNPVAAIVTDSNGNYSFGNLAAGSYSVKFTDDSGKILTTQNVDGDASDDIDSDAADLGNGMSQIDGIVVVAGENTPDNDAGVFPNEAPTATDDSAITCADDEVTVDLSDNFSDADSASVSITMLAGQNIANGQTILVDGTDSNGNAFTGLEVTRDGDAFIFNGESAFTDYDIGESATASLEFKVEDSDGATATASVNVTFKGDANSAESLDDALKADNTQVTFSLQEPATLAEFEDAYTLDVLSSTNAGITISSFEAAYCLDSTQNIDLGVITTANVSVLTEDNLAAVAPTVDATKFDSVNWLLNNDFTQVDNGDGAGDTYSDLEVQEAIWLLLNGDTFFINNPGFTNPEFMDDNNGVRDGVELATQQNAEEIAMAAMAQGDGFIAGDGDVIGLILDPTDPSTQDQPFVIGVRFDDIDCIC